MTTIQAHPTSFDFSAREGLRVQILSLYYAMKEAAARENLPFDTGTAFDDIVTKVAGVEHRADMKAYIATRRRKPKKGTPATPPYPFPDENFVGMVNRLANCVSLRLAQLREIKGPPVNDRNREARFFGVVGAVLKYQPWRSSTYAQAREAVLEELRRRAQQAREWKESVKRESDAPAQMAEN